MKLSALKKMSKDQMRKKLAGFTVPEYEVPKDKKLLFWDFYMIVALEGFQPLSGEDVERQMGYDNAYLNMREYLEKTIKPEVYDALHWLLEVDLFKSIASEGRHIFGHMQQSAHSDLKNNPYYEKYKDAINNLQSSSDTGRGLNERVRVVESIFPDEKTFVEFIAPFFKKHDAWSSAYGGKAWYDICEGWLQLHDTPKGVGGSKDQQMAIDHVFDLAHNTGPALNKNDVWGTWVFPALDYKRYVMEPWDLWHMCSLDMQKFSAKYFKLVGYGSYEDYLENRPYRNQSEQDWSRFEMDREKRDKLLRDRAQGLNPTNDPNYKKPYSDAPQHLEKYFPKNKITRGSKVKPETIKVPGIPELTAATFIPKPEDQAKTYLVKGVVLTEKDSWRGKMMDKSLGHEVVRIAKDVKNEGGTWISGVWLSGVWEKGTFQNGVFASGTWVDGTWERGYWESGEWQNGTWKGGWVYDPQKSGKMIAEVEKHNAENEEDAKKKDSWQSFGGFLHIWLPEGFNPREYFQGKDVAPEDEKYLEAAK